jgi:hypothetical protein
MSLQSKAGVTPTCRGYSLSFVKMMSAFSRGLSRAR